MSVVLVYIVSADAKEAGAIGRMLVEEKLVACANIVPSIHSFFFWQGTLQESQEALLLCKTLSGKIREIEKRVKTMHSHDVPCICFYKAEHVTAEYEKWLRECLG